MQAKIIIIFIFIFIYIFQGIQLSGDTYWNLSCGKYIITNKSIPKTNIFSWSGKYSEWLFQEWLSTAIIYSIYKIGGIFLLRIIFTFFFTFVFCSFLLFNFEKKINPIKKNFNLLILFPLIICFAMEKYISIRPEAITACLFSILFFILFRFEYYNLNKNYLYLIPPIILFWVNLHTSWVVGFVLIFIYVFSKLIDIYFFKYNSSENVNKCKSTIYIFFLSSLFTLFTPYNIKIYSDVIERLNSWQREIIDVFQSPVYNNIPTIAGGILLLLILFLFTKSERKNSTFEFILLSSFLFLYFQAYRYILYFYIVALPLLIHRKIKIKSIKKKSGILFFICLIAGSLPLYNYKQSVENEFKTMDPIIQFLKNKKIKRNFFNHYSFGGYIMWKCYPESLVFIDNRDNVYYKNGIHLDYTSIVSHKSNWKLLLDIYKIKWIHWYGNESNFLQSLLKTGEWVIKIKSGNHFLLKRKATSF